MEEIMKKYEFDRMIMGKDPMTYMAELIEKNDKNELEIERVKTDIGVLKQMHNRQRLLIDAVKCELKANDAGVSKNVPESVESK